MYEVVGAWSGGVGSGEGWWVERGLWRRKCFREMGILLEDSRERLEI